MNKTQQVRSLVLTTVFLALAVLPQWAASAVTDTTPPTGTVIINNNRSATNTPNVTLALTWNDGADGSGVSRMRFSNDGSTWTPWEMPLATRAYPLPTGDGYKTVRVQYLDRANNRSLVYNDFIRLDTTPPTGGIIINSGAATVSGQSVTLGLNWSDGAGAGVTRMRFSDDGATWTVWETPKATRSHILPMPEGYHTIRVQYLDGAGNYSVIYNDYIKMLTTETLALPGGVPLTMLWVPGGTFTMGSPLTEQDRNAIEGPQHTVTLGGFWMGKYELTKGQWQAVMHTAPWSPWSTVISDPDSPAVYVSWDDIQAFLSALNGLTGKTFRLPSEAQWEYACRGGNQAPSTRFYWGDDPNYSFIAGYAWHSTNCANEQYAHLAGQKTANSLGLFDMSGNAWEWCEDDWHDSYTGAPSSGQAWVDVPRGLFRMVRGGGWTDPGYTCRSAQRSGAETTGLSTALGFRVCR